MALTKEAFAALLERAKAGAAQRKEKEAVAAASKLQATLLTRNIHYIDLDLAGAPAHATEEERAEVVDSLIQGLAVSPSVSKQTINPVLSSSLDSLTRKFIGEPKLPVPESMELSTEQSELSLPGLPQRRVIGVARDDITLNPKQQLFVTTILSKGDIVLIGAPGTGKTTVMRSATKALVDSAHIPNIATGTKYFQVGLPGIAIVSFTRKAVNNIRHAVIDILKPHVITLHKMLEFAPEFYEIEDPNSPGDFKNTMRFIPTRNRFNPLPRELQLIVYEESSMISVEHYQLVQDALPHIHQEVFLGDIQQLPPVFGQAILGFKMLELPVIELTEPYRTARDSPIMDLTWKILEGDAKVFSPKTEPVTVYNERLQKSVERITVPALDALSKKVVLSTGGTSELRFQVWQKQFSIDHATMAAIKQFQVWEEEGYYNPQEDVILCPFNKSFGTIEINKGISQYLGRKRNALVYEIIAGFNKYYLAVGDRVLYDKEDAFITSIRKNGSYFGKPPVVEHTKLDRSGYISMDELSDGEKRELRRSMDAGAEFTLESIDAYLEAAADASEERVQKASHVVEIRYAYADELDEPIVLDSAADINNLLGGYCITVHKFQGSEAERVFFLLHASHATMIKRELLLTGVSRARSFLHIICERDTFFKGVRNPIIKGNSLEEKAEWFKGKKEQREAEGKM